MCTSLTRIDTYLSQHGLYGSIFFFVYRNNKVSLCFRECSLGRSVIYNQFFFYGNGLLRRFGMLRSFFNYIAREYVRNGRVPEDVPFQRWERNVSSLIAAVVDNVFCLERKTFLDNKELQWKASYVVSNLYESYEDFIHFFFI